MSFRSREQVLFEGAIKGKSCSVFCEVAGVWLDLVFLFRPPEKYRGACVWGRVARSENGVYGPTEA